MSGGPDRGLDPVEGAGDDNHGPANGEFAAVAFDEAFVRSALVREPSAHERALAGGPSRLPIIDYPEGPYEDDPDGLPLELKPLPFEPGHIGGWHRMLARIMLVVIGIVAVLAAAAAVYRASGGPGPAGTGQNPAPSAPPAPSVLAHAL